MILETKKLLKYAGIAASAQKSGSLIPILNNLLFQEVSGKLVITGSDLETTTVVTTEFDVESGFSVALDNTKLLNLLKGVSDHTFELTLKGTQVVIKTTKGKYKITSFPGSDYPAPPEVEYTGNFEMLAEDLSEALDITMSAVSNDELRPTMSGVCFDMKADSITFVATNGHKLLMKKYNLSFEGEGQIIIPSKPLGSVRKSLGKGSVSVKYSFNSISFNTANVTTKTVLVDGKYPPYERVIPTDLEYKLTVSNHDLTDSLKRVGLFANSGSNTIKFGLSSEGLQISAQDVDYNSEANEKVSSRYVGEDLEIGFNNKYLLEVIGATKSVQFDMKLLSPNKPAVITTSEDEGFLGLVMPTVL